MKKTLFTICLLFAVPALSQEVFPLVPGTQGAGHDRDHKWTQYDTSDRFVIYWDDTEAPISATARQNALNELENIYDSYMIGSKFQPPFTRNPNAKKKMGIYVLRPNEGYAFGGTIADGPGMWLSAGAVSDKWALAHEFMHGLQQATGGLPGGQTNQATNFVGWFHESHANLMPHQVYPTEVHYCAEMYTRMAELYLGSTRNRYCNWQFFEHVIDTKGIEVVNNIWTESVGQNGSDPMTEIMRQNSMSQKDFNDLFGEFATKAVIWDMKRGSALFRNAYNGVQDRYKRQRYTQLESLDSTDGANGRFVSPFMFSPQRYGFNIIRLYPNANNSTVTVKFRGDVQTQNNIPNYTRVQNLEPTVANLPNDPQSDWRYALVAVTGDAASRTGTVTARYSDLMRASDGNPDVSITLQSETQLYLVVAATPKIHHKITWDQYYYTIYRFPYMVEISGAKPEGFQTQSTTGGAAHANGGGFVANTATVAATAYVAPNARVTGNARVQNNARIEGRAVVSGGTVQNNAVVKDYAKVFGGTISGSAIISEHANIINGTYSGNAQVYGFPAISGNVTLTDNAHIGGVGLIESAVNLSGTAQLQGDIEVEDFTANKGVYFGIVGEDKTIGENRTVADYGGAIPKREVTKPRSMQWYGETDPVGINYAKIQGTKSFSLNNRGLFAYNLGDISSANLKIFDTRGKMLKIIHLNSTQGTVDTHIKSTQILFWRVEKNDGKIIGQTKVGTVIK